MLWLYRQLYGGGLGCDLGKVWVLFPWLGWPRLTLVTPWHSVWTWASVPGPPPQPTTGNAFGAAQIYIELQTCSDQAPRAVLWLRRQAEGGGLAQLVNHCDLSQRTRREIQRVPNMSTVESAGVDGAWISSHLTWDSFIKKLNQYFVVLCFQFFLS